MNAMKRAAICLLTLLLLPSLTACAMRDRVANPPAPVQSAVPQTATPEPAQTPVPAPQTAEDPFTAILLGDQAFLAVKYGNRPMTIDELPLLFSDDGDLSTVANEFTLVDLDADGEPECVVGVDLGIDYGYLALKLRDGSVYGYALPYRAFLDPKTDGTFSFSNGAADSGVGRMRFSEVDYTIEPLMYSESDYDPEGELSVTFYVGDAEVSEEEFYAADREHAQQPGAEWRAMPRG